jgi:hypothetical protein
LKHCSFIQLLERFARAFHSEELSVQPHSWCEPFRVFSKREKAVLLQIQSGDTSTAVSARSSSSQSADAPPAS